MKVAITGAAGFIGSHLTDRLLAEGHSVVALDRSLGMNLDSARANDRMTFVGGDVKDLQFVRSSIGADVDVVYHLAAMVGVANYLSDPFEVIDVNVMGTRNVLEVAASHGIGVVISSTSEVYGNNPKTPWAEDDDRVLGSTSVDRWSYSTSKATCEHLALAVHRSRGLPLAIVRYFNVYGPRQSPIYVISRAIHRVLNNKQPLLYDGGEQTRCFTFIDDAVSGTIAAADFARSNGGVFNLGNTTERTIREATEIVLGVAGSSIGWEDYLTHIKLGSSYQDIDRRVPDSSKALEILDWRAETDLPEGVHRTIDWARSNPQWLES